MTGAPAPRSAESARCELPQAANAGVPFMKRATGSDSMICSIWLRTSVTQGSFRGDAELVDCAVRERALEGGVDELVLLDQREPGEARARDRDLEVVAAARAVLDVELGRVGERLGEKLAQRGGRGGHRI